MTNIYQYVTIRFNSAEIKRLKEQGKKEKRSISKIVKDAVKYYIDNHE